MRFAREMGLGKAQRMLSEVTESLRGGENFALYSTTLGMGKRELLLGCMERGSKVIVICPKLLQGVWEKRAREAGQSCRTFSLDYARMNPHVLEIHMRGDDIDFLIIEEPRGAKTLRTLAKLAIKAPRVVVVGFVRNQERLDNAAAVLGVGNTKAMSTLLIVGSLSRKAGQG